MEDEKCIEHTMMIDAQGDKISDLEHAVYGNGKVGLKDRVTAIETQMKVIIAIGMATLSMVVGIFIKLIFVGG
jgi:3-phenylpropionate/cinnamic acid dioxygenase small subunit